MVATQRRAVSQRSIGRGGASGAGVRRYTCQLYANMLREERVLGV